MGEFKDKLRALRLREHLSQAELAERLGVAKSTISMYEVGKREPDFNTLEQIASVFQVDMNYLLGRPPQSGDSVYYLNDDAKEMAQFMFEHPEYKVLFDASRKVRREDIEFVKEMIDRMSGK